LWYIILAFVLYHTFLFFFPESCANSVTIIAEAVAYVVANGLNPFPAAAQAFGLGHEAADVE
jgi:hypothetical protein